MKNNDVIELFVDRDGVYRERNNNSDSINNIPDKSDKKNKIVSKDCNPPSTYYPNSTYQKIPDWMQAVLLGASYANNVITALTGRIYRK